MKDMIISEIRKITSTRLWWILAAIMVVTIAMFVAMLGLSFVFGEQMAAENGEPGFLDPLTMALTVYSTGVTLGYVFPIVAGALFVTSEFRHRTIDTTVIAQPRRIVMVVAKFIAAVPFALIYGVLTAVTSLGTGALALVIGGGETYLGNSEVWRLGAMSAVAMASWMLVGVGIGMLVTNQVAAIVILLGFTQFVEPIARFAISLVEPLAGVGQYFPGAAGDAIMGVSFFETTGASLLPQAAGFAVLMGYAALFAVGGWLTTLRRDIT